eukprot:gene2857-3121_t
MNEIVITRAQENDLPQIKALQLANLSKNLSDEEKASEGFLTADYSLDLLQVMHREAPAVVAKEREGGRVVGYVLAVTKSLYGSHELLNHLMDDLKSLSFEGQTLSDYNYVIVGQLCVAKGYRGRGLVSLLYEAFRVAFSPQHSLAVTEVAVSNPRSLRAHERSGFQIVRTKSYEGVAFHTIAWPWRSEEVAH